MLLNLNEQVVLFRTHPLPLAFTTHCNERQTPCVNDVSYLNNDGILNGFKKIT